MECGIEEGRSPFLISNSTFIIPVEGAGLGRALVRGSGEGPEARGEGSECRVSGFGFGSRQSPRFGT